ncbi:Crp/Fnr family transcriptional regulator [Petrotoga sp. 9PWA.NaAc.5.4]|uniref:Crp/Fnr family transcriptional regulator n=1 Tax=Petrotoga sp. 9PWA.NaAc.5.4 TaxID=1434328 RepID=UPI000CA845A4|nr:Crp/Fnr family transcriptional regulator [Petrotoga sp. 9PWA.NaAc.5.4]PNR96802.1 hypothetical protein X924_01525 [Petrotoga sp. 9PWA.NaAc.5.4]
MDRVIDKISKINIFSNFTKGELLKIFDNIPYSVKEYSKGTLIRNSGERVEEFMILVNGEVITEMIDFNGKSLEIERVKAPDILASALLFAKENYLPVDVIAATNVILIYIEKKYLIKSFKENSDFLLSFLEDVGEKFNYVTEKLRITSFHTIREKITMYLLNLYNKQNKPKEITIPLTMDELASLFGVARPSLSRVISEMQKEGLFEKKGDKVILNNLKKPI